VTSFGERWNELKYRAAGTVTTDVAGREICEEVRAESCYSVLLPPISPRLTTWY